MGFFDVFRSRSKPPATQRHPGQPDGKNQSDIKKDAVPSLTAEEAPKRLAEAWQLLAKDNKEAAIRLIEQVLHVAGSNGMILGEISSELGKHGLVEKLIELIGPIYALEKHGPSAGFNLLQAYLVVGDSAKAGQMLALLKAIDHPELNEKLIPLAGLLEDLREAEKSGPMPDDLIEKNAAATQSNSEASPATPTKISLVSISKPIWYYGLEPMAERILPPKKGNLKHIAFAQFSLPNTPGLGQLITQPEEELGRLSRALPLWFSETLFFTSGYTSIAALGVIDNTQHGNLFALFGTDWTTQHLTQLIETNKEPLDYIVTGSLKRKDLDTEMTVRLWDAKKLKERKVFTINWTPSTMDAELLRFHESLRTFMECVAYPAGQGLPYQAPSVPSAWLDTLGASVALFLVEKGVIPRERLRSPIEDEQKAAARAAAGNAASLAWITLRRRAEKLGIKLAAADRPVLATHPLVAQAMELKS